MKHIMQTKIILTSYEAWYQPGTADQITMEHIMQTKMTITSHEAWY